MSEDLTPALKAGVSSIGEITVKAPSLIPTVIPKPPNSPLVWILISFEDLASKKVECASNSCIRPLSALFTISSSIMSST